MTVRLPSGAFARVLAVYPMPAFGHVEVLVHPDGGVPFRIRACHLRGMP